MGLRAGMLQPVWHRHMCAELRTGIANGLISEEHNMGRNLIPLLILLASGGQASAADFPKSGEAELVNYAVIHELLTIDGVGAGGAWRRPIQRNA
jgi:hypothetical protein